MYITYLRDLSKCVLNFGVTSKSAPVCHSRKRSASGIFL